MELLLTADPLVDLEAMVYGLGTVKLLAGNSSLREQLAGAGVMPLLADTLQKCTDVSQAVSPRTQAFHAFPRLQKKKLCGRPEFEAGHLGIILFPIAQVSRPSVFDKMLFFYTVPKQCWGLELGNQARVYI